MNKTIHILFISLLLSATCLAQTTTENYVKSETMLDAGGTVSMTSVQYYDGLGYPTVCLSPTGGNGETSYTLTTYDGAGREACQYLLVATDNSIAYKSPSTIISNSTAFYGNDDTAYTRNHYDALGRILSAEQPGSAWRSADKRERVEYGVNAASDNVMRYEEIDN